MKCHPGWWVGVGIWWVVGGGWLCQRQSHYNLGRWWQVDGGLKDPHPPDGDIFRARAKNCGNFYTCLWEYMEAQNVN